MDSQIYGEGGRMSTKYCVDADGNYLGGFTVPPEGAIEVPEAPQHAGQKWDNGWGAIPVDTDKEDRDALQNETIAKLLVDVVEKQGITPTDTATYQKIKAATQRKVK